MEKPMVQGRYLGLVEGEVVPKLIEGSAGKKFRGRDVVVFRHPPGLFGTRAGRERVRELAMCNGILNQCTLSEPPTPYWAILDAMCELKQGFTKRQVIDRATRTVGEHKRKACVIAWDVMRNHHRHERKRDAGMSYMVDTLVGSKMAIRARGPGETFGYFQGEAERRATAQAAMAEPVGPAVETPVEGTAEGTAEGTPV